MMGAGPAAVSNMGNVNLVELVGRGHLGLLGQVLDLGLAEDDVGVGGWVLVHVGLLDHKQDVLGFSDGHTGYSSNLEIYTFKW